jgi:hypothetical protein
MRTGVSTRFTRHAMLGVVGLALVASAGCATSPSAYLNRDEPINRTTGAGQEYRGTVVRVDEPQRVVVLDNGQMYRVSGEQAVYVNGQPVVLRQVQPGTPVTIVSGTPVVYQNGQYVVPASGSTTVVAAAPAGTVVAAPNSIVRMYGRVTDLGRDGTVKVRLADGDSFVFRPPAGTIVREGDAVAIDMTFGAPTPSALPR